MTLLTPKEALDYAQWDCLTKKNDEKNIHPDKEQNLVAKFKILKSGLQQLLPSVKTEKDGESIELE